MRISFLLLLSLTLPQFSAHAEIGDQKRFAPPDEEADCGVHKYDADKDDWFPVLNAEIPRHAFFKITKEDVDHKISFFTANRIPYRSKNFCLTDQAEGAKPVKAKPPMRQTEAQMDAEMKERITLHPADPPLPYQGKPEHPYWGWFLLAEYRQNTFNISNGTTSFPINEKWYGAILGVERNSRNKGNWHWLLSGDLEFGTSSTVQDSSVSDQVQVKGTGIYTGALRLRAGVSYALSFVITLSAHLGGIDRYGNYVVPAGYVAIPKNSIDFLGDFVIDVKISSHRSIRLESGAFGSSKNLFFGLGTGTYF